MAILAAAVGGGIALATDHAAEPQPAPKAVSIPAALAEHFAVLSEGTNAGVASLTSADSSTATALEQATQGINQQWGLNASLAREATYGGSQHVWVIPGSAGICIHDVETGQGGCGPVAGAISGDLQLDVGGNEHGLIGGGTIYGLAPNGNSTIVVHDADGSTEDVPVEHNVYIITHRGAVLVDLRDGTGKARTITPPG